MTGWLVATSIVGAAALSPMVYVQAAEWQTHAGEPSRLAEQAVRVFSGSGGRIGVTIRDLSQEDIKAGKAGGVVIESVEAGSPAEKAGFKAEDIVAEFDGERVRSTQQFTRLVQESPTGRPVSAVVLRAGQRTTLNVEPREASTFQFFGPNEFMVARPKVDITPHSPLGLEMMPKIATVFGTGRLGITVDDLSPQLAEYFGTKDGVLVKSVNEDSSASKAGVKAGDVITAINGEGVTRSADLRRHSMRLEGGDEFTLDLVRDKKTMSLKGKVEATPRRPSKRTIL